MNRLVFIFIFSIITVSNLNFNCYALESDSLIKTINSKVLNEERDIIVKLPQSYTNNKTNKYPVLYLLDGENNLNHTSATLEALSGSHLAPELIIIGIFQKKRMAELTPTVDKSMSEPTGKGETLLAFIEQEVIPYINKNYRTEDYKILSGHSLGGLLVISAIQSRPQLFDAHFAFSPSLYWDERSTLKKTVDFLQKTKDSRRHLYINIGSEKGKMRSAFDEFSNQLMKLPLNTINFKAEVFESEPHGITAVVGQYYAFRNLFQKWEMPFYNDSVWEIDKIITHYDGISEYYGYTIYPPEEMIHSEGFVHMLNERPDKAIPYFEHNFENYPGSESASRSFAEGLVYQFSQRSSIDDIEQLLPLIENKLGKKMTDSSFLQRMAWWLKKNGELEWTVALLELSTNTFENESITWADLGDAYADQGKKSAAKEAYIKSLKLEEGKECDWCSAVENWLKALEKEE